MDAERWLTSELASFGCAACGQPYGEAQIRLIAQRDELFFVDLSCPHCGSQAVAIVTIQSDAEPTQAWAHATTAADEPDEASAERAPAISVDEVIDAHVLLRDFDGDVHQLLARLEGPAE
jgi:hypothetical protein